MNIPNMENWKWGIQVLPKKVLFKVPEGISKEEAILWLENHLQPDTVEVLSESPYKSLFCWASVGDYLVEVTDTCKVYVSRYQYEVKNG